MISPNVKAGTNQWNTNSNTNQKGAQFLATDFQLPSERNELMASKFEAPSAGPVSAAPTSHKFHDFGSKGLNIVQPSCQPTSFADDQQELSFYALEDVSSISDLIQSQNLLEMKDQSVSSLRIMHCENLSNINGI